MENATPPHQLVFQHSQGILGTPLLQPSVLGNVSAAVLLDVLPALTDEQLEHKPLL
jgi:hypothetical protein